MGIGRPDHDTKLLLDSFIRADVRHGTPSERSVDEK